MPAALGKDPAENSLCKALARRTEDLGMGLTQCQSFTQSPASTLGAQGACCMAGQGQVSSQDHGVHPAEGPRVEFCPVQEREQGSGAP